ncbi:hypothetical protein ASE17_08870 [Phenylobacterium sp. Root77]|uniref:GNAT family N-acetyltransferase n=1 Tax=unclassified Phenylobacterium TaxID=2640670 RepID=UPI000715BDD5|nr:MULTISPECIES: GNAT family N-acetyltransferase [unclassified Phenylobacterium]KRC40505.1 hypothetical protein ASE17_08870 [Phenylobacterium sp. Root77]
MILETSRLLLRPLAETDLDALGAIAADPKVMAHVGDGVPLSRAATALWISNAAASLVMSEVGSRAVVLRSSGALIGWVGLIPTPHRNRLELIYGFARAYWGQGYATEAAQALMANCSAGTVDATIDPRNRASWRILEKLGFTTIGEEEDEFGLPTLRLRLEVRSEEVTGPC